MVCFTFESSNFFLPRPVRTLCEAAGAICWCEMLRDKAKRLHNFLPGFTSCFCFEGSALSDAWFRFKWTQLILHFPFHFNVIQQFHDIFEQLPSTIFIISSLSWHETVPFFDPPEPQRLSYLFAHLDLLSSETFSFFSSSLLWLFPSLRLFPSLLFICPYCRKFDF